MNVFIYWLNLLVETCVTLLPYLDLVECVFHQFHNLVYQVGRRFCCYLHHHLDFEQFVSDLSSCWWCPNQFCVAFIKGCGVPLQEVCP